MSGKQYKICNIMINYTALPEDGIQFEQLIREIFNSMGFDTFWTGVGPDGGKDLIITEILHGKISSCEKRWLVSCKHYAHSKRAVGVKDIINITDTMRAINATGFILSCSTYPSSSLVRRLDELKSKNKDFNFKIFDGVELEKLILKPNSIHLLKNFFPNDVRNKQWLVHSTEDNGVWSASYSGHYFFCSSRDRITQPPILVIQYIIDTFDPIINGIIDNIRYIVKNKKYNIIFRYRGFWYDDKNCGFVIYLDCQLEKLVSQSQPLEEIIKKSFPESLSVLSEKGKYAYIENIDLNFVYPSFLNEHYNPDSYEDYNPFMFTMIKGKSRHWDNIIW